MQERLNLNDYLAHVFPRESDNVQKALEKEKEELIEKLEVKMQKFLKNFFSIRI